MDNLLNHRLASTAMKTSLLPKNSALFGVLFLLLIGPLAGCFGEEEAEKVIISDILFIDGKVTSDATLYRGEMHDFLLRGENLVLYTEQDDVLLFVNGSIVPTGEIRTDENEVLGGWILTTPYTETVELQVMNNAGITSQLTIPLENGTPVVNGEDWYEKMEFITSVCSDSSACGGYVNRWMGTPNPAFERAAAFFQGHFEGLGYETDILRVNDHLNPSQPESLNVIAWKEGRSDTCVQGMGAHFDIAPPGGPPGGGTYEGAYDNTAGTVTMMLFARAFVDMTFECDTFLALWSSEEEGLRGSNAFANNDCDACLPQDKELRFYINMDMMGISWPAYKPTGEPYPYHAWSGPDSDPNQQDVEITSILDHVHRNILKAPMNLTIEGTYGAGCDQHWDEHENLVMDVHEDTFGRSDHVTFRNLGAQTIFHLGAYDADYDAYHSPSDTLDNMIQMVGGVEEIQKSIEFVMWAAMLEFLIADQTPEIRNLN
ncbi:MAG: M28 family peptidase [Candidatus Poseidoniales archaeon]